MSFLLDLLCAALMILLIVVVGRRPVSSALLTMASLLAALPAAFFLSLAVSLPAADVLVAPLVEKRAANDLADLFSAPYLKTGRETVAGLDFTQLLESRPEAFVNRVEKYGADIEEAAAAYREGGSAALLEAVTRGYCRALSRAAVFLAAYLLLAFLFRFICRRIENNLPPPPKQRLSRRVGSFAAAAVCAVTAVMALGVVLEAAIPYLEHGSVIFSTDALRGSVIYEYLNRINPFVQLYK